MAQLWYGFLYMRVYSSIIFKDSGDHIQDVVSSLLSSMGGEIHWDSFSASRVCPLAAF